MAGNFLVYILLVPPPNPPIFLFVVNPPHFASKEYSQTHISMLVWASCTTNGLQCSNFVTDGLSSYKMGSGHENHVLGKVCQTCL